MLHRRELTKYILLALSIGIIVASTFTSIKYPCSSPGDAGCVLFDKAVMHPVDLASNMQGSLIRFLFDLLLVTVLVLGLLVSLNAIQGRKRKPKQ